MFEILLRIQSDVDNYDDVEEMRTLTDNATYLVGRLGTSKDWFLIRFMIVSLWRPFIFSQKPLFRFVKYAPIFLISVSVVVFLKQFNNNIWPDKSVLLIVLLISGIPRTKQKNHLKSSKQLGLPNLFTELRLEWFFDCNGFSMRFVIIINILIRVYYFIHYAYVTI